MEHFEYVFDGLRIRRIQYNGGRFPGRVFYQRRRPDRLKPRIESEKLNHYLFDMMQKQLRPLEKYVEIGYRHGSGKRTGMYAALWWMNKYALIRKGFHDSEILPNLISISHGNLAMEDTFQGYFDPETSEICVTWDTTLPPTLEGQKAASADDRLMIVAQDVWGSYEAYGKIDGATRSAGTERVLVASNMSIAYFVYMAFISADGTSQSYSISLQDPIYTDPACD